MALSDSCFEFLESFGEAARKLAEEAYRYSAPDNPLHYGEKIDAIRRACISVMDAPSDPEAGARLLCLAVSVIQYHDTPPGTLTAEERGAAMMELVRLLRSDLNIEEASSMWSTVGKIVNETPLTEQATKRLAALLPRLGKATHDAAIKIITDIGSATARKMLGL